MDPQFLKEKCYPYFGEAEKYLSPLLNQSPTHNTLPLSSSPEYHDNSIQAWFTSITNFDLALLQSFYKTGAEVAATAYSTRRPNEWLGMQMLLPTFDTNQTGLTVSHNQNLESSHRHHSPYMAIYPLQLLSAKDDTDKRIIDQSLRWIEQKGTRNWVGYSFSWAACLYAVAKESDSAVSMLQKFASNFCSPNSFHLNGDQKGGQYAAATYRPFTLEGNFAFAQGIHELLIQSHHDYIDIFPATPAGWKDVSFQSLRTEGAFLVSASKQNGVVQEVSIVSTAGGLLQIKLPFKTWIAKGVDSKNVKMENGIASIETNKGQQIIFKNGFE
jgi:alpha-L-fucosidase 2